MNQAELLIGALASLEDTAHSSGTATAPSTATDILTTPQTLKSGLYELDVTVALTGTAETLTRNLNLRLGTAVLVANIPTVPGTNRYRFRMRITNTALTAAGGTGTPIAAAVQARTAAAPTAGAVYTVSVQSTLIGG